MLNNNSSSSPPHFARSLPSSSRLASQPSLPASEPRQLEKLANINDAQFSRCLDFNRVTDPFAGTHVTTKGVELLPSSTSPCESNGANGVAEDKLWQDAIENAFITSQLTIDLMFYHLNRIHPQYILEFGKMVVLSESSEKSTMPPLNSLRIDHSRRAFTRIQTAPASTSGWSGIKGKGLVDNEISTTPKRAMNLYLGVNNITKLPKELWTLTNLTNLSLRNNNITYLPPEISRLKHLTDLNIAHNKVRFIPSELMNMANLTNLLLFPNPFIPEPPPLKPTVSEATYTSFHIPSLTEIALRILLSPAEPPSESSPWKTRLEQLYNLPLPNDSRWRPISGPIRRVLSACVPGSLATDRREDSEQSENALEITGVGLCPNPKHVERSVFVKHAEERYTWEKNIAGLDKLGGAPAVLWRGCQRGCLDFLIAQHTPFKNESVVENLNLINNDAIRNIQFDNTAELDFDD